MNIFKLALFESFSFIYDCTKRNENVKKENDTLIVTGSNIFPSFTGTGTGNDQRGSRNSNISCNKNATKGKKVV